MWKHSGRIHEDHDPLHSTHNREPLINDSPVPTSDEEALGKGRKLRWGKALGKND